MNTLAGNTPAKRPFPVERATDGGLTCVRQYDYHVLLSALDELDDDLPVLLEHLDSAEAYERAAGYVRDVADEVGVDV
ncbi:MAG: hypothetical protein V5A44_10985 [Haloarculaceae archaeon]